MHNIRAISLDLDDTLWEIGPVIRRAEAELWAWLGEHYPRIVQRFTQQSAFDIRRRIAMRNAGKAHDLSFLRKQVLAHMATESGYAAAVADDAFSVFDAARNRVDLYPDVEPALAQLSGQFALLALTNGNASLEQIGINHYFQGTVNAADAGAAKPAPRIFEAASEHLGIAASDILHVGDHPEYDIAGAADVGMRTAWINRTSAQWPTHLRPPDAMLRSMTDLAELLAVPQRNNGPG